MPSPPPGDSDPVDSGGGGSIAVLAAEGSTLATRHTERRWSYPTLANRREGSTVPPPPAAAASPAADDDDKGEAEGGDWAMGAWKSRTPLMAEPLAPSTQRMERTAKEICTLLRSS